MCTDDCHLAKQQIFQKVKLVQSVLQWGYRVLFSMYIFIKIITIQVSLPSIWIVVILYAFKKIMCH